jgi:hypothetical protein
LNAAAGDLLLNDAEVIRIDRALPRGSRPNSLPKL